MLPDRDPAIDASFAYIEGDYWPGFERIQITVRGAVPATAAASATIQWKNSAKAVVKTVTVTVVDATNWYFSADAADLGVMKGDYTWRFRVVDANGVVQTYLEGDQLVEE